MVYTVYSTSLGEDGNPSSPFFPIDTKHIYVYERMDYDEKINRGFLLFIPGVCGHIHHRFVTSRKVCVLFVVARLFVRFGLDRGKEALPGLINLVVRTVCCFVFRVCSQTLPHVRTIRTVLCGYGHFITSLAYMHSPRAQPGFVYFFGGGGRRGEYPRM